MKRLMTLIIAAVMAVSLSCAVWGSELPANITVEYATDAVMDGVSQEEKDQIVDLLALLPDSGVFDMLDGFFSQTDEDLAKGTINNIAGRRELSFTDGYIPKEDTEEPEREMKKVKISRITKTPDIFEVTFTVATEWTSDDYKAQMKIREEDGTKKCALTSIWRDQDELVMMEAVSEVFEDYFEEEIEPLY